MKVIVDLCVVPLGIGVSLSPYVAACEKILSEAGLKTQLHANGTNIEGEWDETIRLIKKCHRTVMKTGERVVTTISIDDRKGKPNRIESKVKSIEQRLGKSLKK